MSNEAVGYLILVVVMVAIWWWRPIARWSAWEIARLRARRLVRRTRDDLEPVGPPTLPVCDHRIHWQYVSVRNMVVNNTQQSWTKYSRACRACGLTESRRVWGHWTLDFLESDVGRASDLSKAADED